MPFLQPTRHPTLVDRVVEHVYGRILRRDLAPGQRITEDEIAGEFGVSRTPVREAVKRLAEAGLIVIFPRARLEVANVTLNEVVEITQLREDLECLSLRYAVPRLSDSDIASLHERVERCCRLARGDDRYEVFREDSAFHLAIAAMGGNRYLLETLQRLDVKVQLSRATMCLTRRKIRDSVEYHREIMDAICRRDVEAACERMRRHVRGTLRQLEPQTREKYPGEKFSRQEA